MYFRTRGEAGEQLAEELLDYRTEPTMVLALSPGGVMVGESIAKRLATSLSLLLTARVTAPGDTSLVFGTLDEGGLFTYNSMISAGEMEEYLQDFHTWVEEEKLRHLYQMASAVGSEGAVGPELFMDKNVVIATDGVKNGLSFDAALHFLGMAGVRRTIAAIPVGPAETIERISHMVDELHYLYIPDNFLTVSHYYTEEGRISQEEVMTVLGR